MINLILKPGNHKTALSAYSAGTTGALVIRPNGQQPALLCGNKTALALTLRELADQLDAPAVVTSGNAAVLPGVTKMPPTPAEVIEYFYTSPYLAEYAADVEETLSKMIPNYNRQLLADLRAINPALLFENGKPVKGIQSRIGEMLNIPNAGQANRSRILAIVSELTRKYSTTTLKTPENGAQAA